MNTTTAAEQLCEALNRFEHQQFLCRERIAKYQESDPAYNDATYNDMLMDYFLADRKLSIAPFEGATLNRDENEVILFGTIVARRDDNDVWTVEA